MTSVAYTDSNIWVAWLLGEDRKISEVNAVIDSIDKGERQAVVSTLVVLEILDVIRKRILEKENAAQDTVSYDRAMKIIGKKMIKFVEKITDMGNQDKVIFSDGNRTVSDLLKEALKVSRKMVPSAVPLRYCNVCNQSIDPPKTRHGGVGHYDIEHSLIAVESGCDEMVSLDQWMKKLRGATEFSSLRFTLL